jgi:hypothetical protein
VSLATLIGTLAQLAGLGLVGGAVGALLWERDATASSVGARAHGAPERALLSVAGFVAFSAALMVAHIATGGAVFGLPGIVPALAALLVWRARGLFAPLWGRSNWRRPGAGVLVVVALATLYVLPVVALGSSLKTGDAPWHGGWTEQLLGGDPVPTGPAPVYGANAYPWGFHALAAALVRLVPGTSAPVAAEALHLLVVATVPLAGAVLARRLRADAGWWGAAAAGLVGGFGWLAVGEPTFFTSPTEARVGADLVVASPNAVYELFPPALPRELGIVLLASAGLLLLSALTGGRPARLRAGVATGLVGLVSVPLFVSACLWALATAALVPRHRARFLATVGGAAAATFALWAGPALADYLRYGGFVNVTPELGVEWPLITALGSWGLLFPLAGGGVLLALRAGPGSRPLLGWLVVTAGLLLVARARAELGWDLAGNATLLHQGRVWPVAHLLGAAFAGAALAWGYGRATRRARPLGAAAGAAVLACGMVSPWLASQGLEETMRRHEGGYVYTRSDVAAGSFLRRAAARLCPRDVVAVPGGPALALLLWQFSGAKLATYDDPRTEHNDLRIRYRELAEAWDRRMAAGGFRASHVVAPEERAPAGEVLERGAFGGRTWVLVRRS